LSDRSVFAPTITATLLADGLFPSSMHIDQHSLQQLWRTPWIRRDKLFKPVGFALLACVCACNPTQDSGGTTGSEGELLSGLELINYPEGKWITFLGPRFCYASQAGWPATRSMSWRPGWRDGSGAGREAAGSIRIQKTRFLSVWPNTHGLAGFMLWLRPGQTKQVDPACGQGTGAKSCQHPMA
jgi:hypothetical protein